MDKVEKLNKIKELVEGKSISISTGKRVTMDNTFDNEIGYEILILRNVTVSDITDDSNNILGIEIICSKNDNKYSIITDTLYLYHIEITGDSRITLYKEFGNAYINIMEVE